MNNYYDILGIDKSADKREVKKAYLKLAKVYHPDVNGNSVTHEDKFKLISEAYDTLSDESKRFRYDHGLTSFTPTTPQQKEQTSKKRTFSREQKIRRDEYKTQTTENQKKDNQQRKKFIPFMVAGYVAAMIGVISFFVDRQSKLAAELYTTAKTNLKENNFRSAQVNVKELLEFEAYLEAEIIQAGIYISTKKADLALEHLQNVEEKVSESDNNTQGDYYYYKGRAFYLQGEGKLAISAFNRAHQYKNGDSEIHFWKGKTYNDKLLDYEKAAISFSKISKNSSFYEEGILLLGIALQNNRKFMTSQKYLIQALNYKKQKALANYHLGWHHELSNKQTSKACIYWETSAKMGYAEALYQYKRHCR